jgi:hypothetical protein
MAGDIAHRNTERILGSALLPKKIIVISANFIAGHVSARHIQPWNSGAFLGQQTPLNLTGQRQGFFCSVISALKAILPITFRTMYFSF